MVRLPSQPLAAAAAQPQLQYMSPGGVMTSPVSPVPAVAAAALAHHTPRSAQQQLLSQQAQRLLEEAKNENRMLEETVATLKEQVHTDNALMLHH